MLPAGGRQHSWCIIPQAVTNSLVLLKKGKIIARNMLSWLELLISRIVVSSWLSILFIFHFIFWDLLNNLIVMVPCIIILNLIKTSLMYLFSVLLHLNLLYMFRMQLSSILRSINMYIQVVQESARVVICSPVRLVPTAVGTRRTGEQITTRALSCTTCMYILMLLRMDESCIRNM